MADSSAARLAAVEGNLERYAAAKAAEAQARTAVAASDVAAKRKLLTKTQIADAELKYALKDFLVSEG